MTKSTTESSTEKKSGAATGSGSDLEITSFEGKLGELETLVEELESGELELADSLDRFKKGIALSKDCRELLDSAQQTVETLIDPDDERSLRPFDARSGSEPEAKSATPAAGSGETSG